MRIMAIDYGDAHTGIAISDPTGFLTGLPRLSTAERRRKWQGRSPGWSRSTVWRSW